MLSTTRAPTEHPKLGSKSLSGFLKRKKHWPPPQNAQNISTVIPSSSRTDGDETSLSPPPPPPPKDRLSVDEFGQRQPSAAEYTKPRSHTVSTPGYQHHQQLPAVPQKQQQQQQAQHHSSKLSSARIPPPLDRTYNLSESFYVVPRPTPPPIAPELSLPLPSTFMRPQQPPLPKDPKERARLRIEAQKQREKEEEKAMQEEMERQARIKQEKEEMRRQEEEEEEERKALLAREIQLASAQRQRKMYFSKAEEEKQKQLLEERKRLERERRLEESRKLEEWRRERAQQAEETKRAADLAKKQEEHERLSKILQAQRSVSKQAEQKATTGYLTIQLGDSVIANWKRRYFKLSEATLLLYKSIEDAEVGNRPIETVELHGNITRLCEWNDGYEELKAIPNSFAIEFKDRTPWSLFSDTDFDKFKLLALLQQASGLS